MINGVVTTKRFLMCPVCQRTEWEIEHLINSATTCGERRSFGPWHCSSPECGSSVTGVVTGNGQVHVEVNDSVSARGFALLRLGHLYLVWEGRLPRDPDFFFHSHQCPDNLLRSVVAVFDDEHEDPHGEIRFIAQIPWSQDAHEKLVGSVSHGDLWEGVCEKTDDLLAIFGTDGQEPLRLWPPM